MLFSVYLIARQTGSIRVKQHPQQVTHEIITEIPKTAPQLDAWQAVYPHYCRSCIPDPKANLCPQSDFKRPDFTDFTELSWGVTTQIKPSHQCSLNSGVFYLAVSATSCAQKLKGAWSVGSRQHAWHFYEGDNSRCKWTMPQSWQIAWS